MKILILGGTRFLGRHLVDAALAAGHQVTLFNRGQTNPTLFPHLETILGDREHDIEKVSGREWDAVVDVAGYVPRIVRLSVDGLARSVQKYVFISSISAYADFSKIGIDESDPVAQMPEQPSEENDPETYGPRKTLSERFVQEVYGDRALIIRPGLIVGPHDPTDRFTYWPMRVQRGGDMITPDSPDAPVQIIDVRDLSTFIIRLIEANASGIYNATGPDYELTLGEMLNSCRRVTDSVAAFHWTSTEFLKEHHVEPWSDMPVWIPEDEPGMQGFSRVDVSKAINAGLQFRPLDETIHDTVAWAETRPEDHIWRAGLDAAKEEALMDLLKRDVQ